ncbi:hypothetical protein [Nocardia nepalensis]|uniref:hypothetical protein n=1 Tax=Nocardia nepalensis TaxID=3375448 RepID=UPI003B67DFA5
MDKPLIVAPAAGVPARYFLLRRRLARILRELGVDATDGPDAIIGALAWRLGKPIEVHQHVFRVPGYFGATVAQDDGFHIFVQAATSREHQTHVAMHEIAHILLGTLDSAAAAMISGTHRSGDYDNPEERDAEFVARVITAWVNVALDARLVEQANERAASLARSLEDRIAWS